MYPHTSLIYLCGVVFVLNQHYNEILTSVSLRKNQTYCVTWHIDNIDGGFDFLFFGLFIILSFFEFSNQELLKWTQK